MPFTPSEPNPVTLTLTPPHRQLVAGLDQEVIVDSSVFKVVDGGGQEGSQQSQLCGLRPDSLEHPALGQDAVESADYICSVDPDNRQRFKLTDGGNTN